MGGRLDILKELEQLKIRRQEILDRKTKHTELYLEESRVADTDQHLQIRNDYRQRLQYAKDDLKYLEKKIKALQKKLVG